MSERKIHPPRLEIACFTVTSALAAINAGADRIELCGGPSSSGDLTPAIDNVKRVKDAAGGVPVHVMIRPRGGGFVYTDAETGRMQGSMHELGQWADGFVLGALRDDGGVHVSNCVRLLAAAGQKPCVFHRAVDQARDYVQALGVIRDLGFAGVLTSGMRATALEGTHELGQAVQHMGDAVQVIVGGGVRSKHLAQLRLNTNAPWFHSSALVDGGEVADEEEIKSMLHVLRNRD